MEYTKKEQLIYDNCGGGEKGENAVSKYRKFNNEYNYMLKEQGREWKRMSFLPRNEKGYINPVSEEDDYE